MCCITCCFTGFQLALLVLVGIHTTTMKRSTVFICMLVDKTLVTIMMVIELMLTSINNIITVKGHVISTSHLLVSGE